MARFGRTFAALAVVLAACLSWGQTLGETYRLQPEDVLIIQIYRVQEVNAVVPVGPDGNIAAPFVGVIRAAGKTLKELEYDLTVAYVDRLKLKDPIVSVTIRDYRQIKASVGGHVNRSGVYTLRPGDRLRDLFNQGGGVIDDGRADLRHAYLIKKGSQERIPLDLQALMNGDNSQNYTVEDGDTLTIPQELENRIIVAGRVRQQGPQIFRDGMRLYEAISLAQKDERRARMTKIQVFRRIPGRKNDFLAIEANLVDFEKRKDPSQNIILQAGDFVYVPDNGNIDFEAITSIANVLFIFDRFGFKPFGG